MERIDYLVPSPLADCFAHCETECIAGCCGIDAFEPTAEAIRAWMAAAGEAAALAARGQLETMIAVVADASKVCSIELLNAHNADPMTRGALLELLAAFQRGLVAT